MGQLFDRAGINRGVTTGETPAVLGDREVRVISAAIVDINGTPSLADNVTAEEITDLLGVQIANITDNGDDTYTVTRTDGATFVIQATGGTGSGTIQVNDVTVTNPNFTDTAGSRGITYSQIGGRVGARANSDDAKQDNLTSDQLAVVNANPFTTADESKLDAIPDFTSHSNLPRLTADLVADREYVIWVTNNTGTNTNAIDRTAVDIQGQDASALQGTTVSIIAGRTIPLYVSWDSTTVGDIQNNATDVEPTITFTTPAAIVHVATGEDVSTGGGGGINGITIEDSGTVEGTTSGVTTVNFVGAGVFVTPSDDGTSVDVNISGDAEAAPTMSSSGSTVGRFQNPANQSRTVTFTASPSATTTFTVDGSGDLTNFVLGSAPTGVTYGTPTLNDMRNQVSVPVTVNSNTVTSNVSVSATATLVVTASGQEYPNISSTALVSVVDARRRPTTSPTSISRSVFNTANVTVNVNGMNTLANLNAGLAYDITNTVNWTINNGSGATGTLSLINGSGSQAFAATQLITSSSTANNINFDYNESNPRLNGQTGTAPSNNVGVSFYTPWYYSTGTQPTAITSMTSVERNFASTQTQTITGTVGNRVWLATTGSSVTFLLGASTTPGVMVGTLSRNNAAGQSVTFNLFRGPQLASASSTFTITS